MLSQSVVAIMSFGYSDTSKIWIRAADWIACSAVSVYVGVAIRWHVSNALISHSQHLTRAAMQTRVHIPARLRVCNGPAGPKTLPGPFLCAAPGSTWIKGERPRSGANLMRDHLALTVCFSRDRAPRREKMPVSDPPEEAYTYTHIHYTHTRVRVRTHIYIYIYRRVHGQAVPFMACIANPIAITSAIWAWNYTRRNRYERIVDSSIKVFDPSFSSGRCPFCPGFHSALDQALPEQFVTLSGVCNLQQCDTRCFSRQR